MSFQLEISTESISNPGWIVRLRQNFARFSETVEAIIQWRQFQFANQNVRYIVIETVDSHTEL
jgi:hypothetical protein